MTLFAHKIFGVVDGFMFADCGRLSKNLADLATDIPSQQTFFYSVSNIDF